MLQTGALIRDLSVRELLVELASLYPAPLDVDETIALAGIDIAGRRTQKLSGGQTQRVRFALALVTTPELLVLDEPTVAMDVEARHAFWTTMRDFAARGKTALFATHYLEEARRFFVLSLGFPVALYFMIAVPNRDSGDLGGTGLSAPLYFMAGLAAFGTMNAMPGAGVRIAGERQVGWNRQLRLTPLSPRT